MSDNNDWLGFEDDSERRAAQGPAFVAPLQYGPLEMIVRERMRRMQAAGCSGADTVVFEEDDEGTMTKEHAEKWRVLLGWPRPPTAAEAMAIKISREGKLMAAYWDELREAIAQDACDGFVPSMGPPSDSGSQP